MPLYVQIIKLKIDLSYPTPLFYPYNHIFSLFLYHWPPLSSRTKSYLSFSLSREKISLDLIFDDLFT
jgi:hypothetical protein